MNEPVALPCPPEIGLRVALEFRLQARNLPVAWLDYCPHIPHPKQEEFLYLTCREALFGGAAGGGKSDAALMASIMYMDTPGYAAIIIRKTYEDLSLPGGLIPRSHEWFGNTDAIWNGIHKQWIFPRWGSTLNFAYMDTDLDVYRYQGSEFQGIFWEEVTQHAKEKYDYLFTRLRSTRGVRVPFRVRCTANPDGVGASWVKRKFIDEKTREPGIVFIPSWIKDNPSIRQSEYIESLNRLSPVMRARYLEGDWTVLDGGYSFDRSWFKTVLPVCPPGHVFRCRAWDLAATTGPKSKRTAGVRMSLQPSRPYYLVEHVVKGKWVPGERDDVILMTAKMDGPGTAILLEQEPGSGGIGQNAAIQDKLRGYNVLSIPVGSTSGDKFKRAAPMANAAHKFDIGLVAGSWNEEYLDELHAANEDAELLDQMDASTLAFSWLLQYGTEFGHGAPIQPEKGTRPARDPDEIEEERLRDPFYNPQKEAMKAWRRANQLSRGERFRINHPGNRPYSP